MVLDWVFDVSVNCNTNHFQDNSMDAVRNIGLCNMDHHVALRLLVHLLFQIRLHRSVLPPIEFVLVRMAVLQVRVMVAVICAAVVLTLVVLTAAAIALMVVINVVMIAMTALAAWLTIPLISM